MERDRSADRKIKIQFDLTVSIPNYLHDLERASTRKFNCWPKFDLQQQLACEDLKGVFSTQLYPTCTRLNVTLFDIIRIVGIERCCLLSNQQSKGSDDGPISSWTS
jgi:hypothetical protein